jgi:hypothetical protein
MATVPQVRRFSKQGILPAALLLVLASGCVTISINKDSDSKKTEGPVRVIVRWDNEVRFAPNTQNGGSLIPGIVGRVYLFGQKVDYPTEAEGAIHVEVADASQSPPKTLEEWKLDPATVRKHLRKDAWGMGYSLFLPWATFRPDLKLVELKLAFKQTNGSTLFATPARVMFDHAGMPGQTSSARFPQPVPEAPKVEPQRSSLPQPRPVEMPRR